MAFSFAETTPLSCNAIWNIAGFVNRQRNKQKTGMHRFFCFKHKQVFVNMLLSGKFRIGLFNFILYLFDFIVYRVFFPVD